MIEYEEDKNKIGFNVESFSEYFNYEEYSKIGFTTSKNQKYNFGIGLSLISDMSKNLKIDLAVRQIDKKLKYEGVWFFNTL